MKIQKLIAMLLIPFAIMLSCKKDGGILPAKLSATIDGAKFESFAPAATVSEGLITITATSLSGKVLIITINANSPGTYKVSDVKCAGSYKNAANVSLTDTYISTSGTVILTQISPTLVGEFNFSMVKGIITAPIKIENGVINEIKPLIN